MSGQGDQELHYPFQPLQQYFLKPFQTLVYLPVPLGERFVEKKERR